MTLIHITETVERERAQVAGDKAKMLCGFKKAPQPIVEGLSICKKCKHIAEKREPGWDKKPQWLYVSNITEVLGWTIEGETE